MKRGKEKKTQIVNRCHREREQKRNYQRNNIKNFHRISHLKLSNWKGRLDYVYYYLTYREQCSWLFLFLK